MYDETVQIEQNAKVNGEYYQLVFHSKNLAQNVQPGQFLNLKINSGTDPFLRRPFSYYRVSASGRVEILYEVLGKGTHELTKKRPGESILAMGPLGKPFTAALNPGQKRILVAGGVGVPPLVFMAEKFKTDFLLIGARSKRELLPKSELSKIKAEILYSTDDGSVGHHGFVTELLKALIEKEYAKDFFIQTCGPMPMMQRVIQLAHDFSIPGEASMDKNMACGVGACLGCMVKTKSGWRTSCKEGPVFKFEEISTDEHG